MKKTQKTHVRTKTESAKKILSMLLGAVMILTMASCADNNSDNNYDIQATDNTINETTITINASPDKYTWYTKNYVGKNCASIGYTALNGKRMDRYGDAILELVFVATNGSYVDAESVDILKEYTVVKQSLAPNTMIKLVFGKDSKGNEYDSIVESQNYKEIVLSVKKNGSKEQNSVDLTEIKPSPDKYTQYIADYTGRNLAGCGYTSLGGDLMDEYGCGYIRLIIVSDDGTYIDPKDKELMSCYVVTGQSVAPNTELKFVFDKDSKGVEYDTIVESQNIEEIEVYVKRFTATPTFTQKQEEESEATTKKTEPETMYIPKETTAEETEKDKTTEDGMRPEFKAAMDSYESFINEYVEFMKKYMDNPGNISLLMDYSDYMTEYSDFVEDFEEWEDDEEMNTAETAYYIDVQARVSKKLLEINE